MSNKVFLISETYLKNNYSLNQNVDTIYINSKIIKVQNIHLQDKLGTLLLNAIKTMVTGATITGDYQTLLEDYIQPYVGAWTMVEIIPDIKYKVMNKGLVEQNSDNSSPADLEATRWRMQILRDEAEALGERLRLYLLDNYTLFPEYFAARDIDDIPPSTESNYFGGMYLGGTNNNCGLYSYDKNYFDYLNKINNK